MADSNHDDPLPAVLAIDGGNSKTDVALVADDGTVLASVRGPGASHEDFGLEEAMRRLGEIVHAAAAPGQRPGGRRPVARHTSACLAGADLPEEEAMLTAAIQRQGWSQTAAVANDTFAVLRAGLTPGDGERAWGIAVTCGAGINCVGVAPDGPPRASSPSARSAATGAAVSGSARRRSWHAIRAEDGRGEPTELRAAVPAFYRLPSMHDVAVAFHLGTARRRRPDPAARRPVRGRRGGRRGGPEPGRAPGRGDLRDGGDRDQPPRPGRQPGHQEIPVVLGGGVLEARNPLLTDAITRRLADSAPTAVVRIVDAPPVTGAALLGLDHLGAGPAAETRLRASYVRES